MNSDSVEFRFNVQEIPSKFTTRDFVDKIKEKMYSKGLQENKDFTLEIKTGDLHNIMKVGGRKSNYCLTDNTFPYCAVENLLDYIDNNIYVIRPENIKTDDYKKGMFKKDKSIDDFFFKKDVPQTVTVEDDEKDDKLKTWEALTNPTAETPLPTPPTPPPPLMTNEKPEVPKTQNLSNIVSVKKEIISSIEKEYQIVLYLKKKYMKNYISKNLGERELKKLLEML